MHIHERRSRRVCTALSGCLLPTASGSHRHHRSRHHESAAGSVSGVYGSDPGGSPPHQQRRHRRGPACGGERPSPLRVDQRHRLRHSTSAGADPGGSRAHRCGDSSRARHSQLGLLQRENWYDLTAYLGGEVYAITDTGFVGGIAGSRAFLRFPDGRTIVPWSAPAPVRLIGSSGHFAGYRANTVFQPEWYVGNPDGSITTIPPSSVGVSMSFGGINRHGVIVGGLHRHGGRFSVFVYRDGIVSEGLIPISSGLRLELAYGINDAGYIIALATPAALPYFTSSRAVLLVPSASFARRD